MKTMLLSILLFLLLTVVSIYCIRQSDILKQLLYSYLNGIGVCSGKIIYTPVSKIMAPNHSYDLILLSYFHNEIFIYYLFHRKIEVIPIIPVPVGHRLVHIVVRDGVNQVCSPPEYEKGTPFSVEEGHLSLQERKRKGITFTYSEVTNSTSWPM